MEQPGCPPKESAATRRSKDPDRVDLNDPDEVGSWIHKLGVSKEEFLRAVAIEGNAALNLVEHFTLRRR